MIIAELKTKRIHVVGVGGTEGSAIALWLLGLGAHHVIGHDVAETKEQFVEHYYRYHEGQSRAALQKQINTITSGIAKVHVGEDYLKGIRDAEVIFAPSSWFRHRRNFPELERLSKDKSKIFWSLYNIFIEFFPGIIIGVTGTAGKGTVTHLIYDALKAAEKPTALIGDAWKHIDIAKILKLGKQGILVYEVNNRALTFAQYSRTSPHIGLITNITSNHLDDHSGSFAMYAKTKAGLLKHQHSTDYCIVNDDNVIAARASKISRAKKVHVSRKKAKSSNVFIERGDICVLDNGKKQILGSMNTLPLFGPHMESNVLMAAAALRVIGIAPKIIWRAFERFAVRPSRMQLLRTIRGVRYIDDSASTRPDATAMAIASFPKGTTHLILGGSRKQELASEWGVVVDALSTHSIKSVALIGSLAPFLKKIILKKIPKMKLESAPDLKSAVEYVRSNAKRGEIVLISPGAESFGMYRDYRERGKEFGEIVKNLKT